LGFRFRVPDGLRPVIVRCQIHLGCATELDYTEHELQSKKYQYIVDKQYRWSAWAAPKKRDGSFDHDKALTGDDLIKYVDGKLFPYRADFEIHKREPHNGYSPRR
jgi:hypothetical protein